MDFALSPEIEDYRQRIREFVAEHVRPLENLIDYTFPYNLAVAIGYGHTNLQINQRRHQ